MANKPISILYQNVRGLRTKADEFFTSVVGSQHDIIAVTETSLNEYSLSSDYFDDSWIVFRADRSDNCGKEMGGGSLVAVSRRLSVFRRSDLECADECVWIEICLKREVNLLIGCHYFSPDTKPVIIDSYLKAIIDKVERDQYRIIMLGDFNIPGVHWGDRSFNEFAHFYARKKAGLLFDFMDDTNLDQFNFMVPRGGKSILDLVLSNMEVDVERSTEYLVSPDLFHDPLVISIKIDESVSLADERVILDYSKGDYFGLYNAIKEENWEATYLSTTANDAASNFNATLTGIIKRFVPTKRLKHRTYPSWFSGELIKCLKDKNKAHKNFKKSGLNRYYQVFSALRKRAKVLHQRDKLQSALNTESELKTKPTNVFKYVKSFLNDSRGVRSIKINDAIITDAKDLSNEFGKYFQSVYQPRCQFDYQDDFAVEDMLDISQNINVPVVTVEGVLEAIAELRPRTAAGVDGIPPYIIKGVANLIAPVLAWIFNLSLDSASFPECWKTALVSPIPKKGDLHDVKNYRPVSVLNSVSKVFEKVIYKHLFSSLYNVIDVRQHGFMTKRSTATNLNELVSFVAPLVENRGQADVIYFDFRKAFDTVPHDVLLRKLLYYGVTGSMLKWIQSYLVDRPFKVKVAGALSTEFIATSGVPQGSNLGPLFFILFINDIGKGIKSRMLLFADDLKIFGRVNDYDEYMVLQKDIDNVHKWAASNKMLLNLDKTLVVTYSRKTLLTLYDYNINGVKIRRESVIADLGVTFDSKLLFTTHVDNIVSKARRNLGLLLWVCRYFRSVSTVLRLYQAIVRPILEYCSVIWNYNRDFTDKKIEAVQKKVINHLRYRGLLAEVSYEENCVRSGLMPLQQRRVINDIMFFHKAIHGHVEVDISTILYRVPHVTNRRFDLYCHLMRSRLAPIPRCIDVVNKISRQGLQLDVLGTNKSENFRRDLVLFFNDTNR